MKLIVGIAMLLVPIIAIIIFVIEMLGYDGIILALVTLFIAAWNMIAATLIDRGLK